MPRIANISADLTLESASFTSGLKKAVQQSATSAKAIEGHLNTIVNAGKALVGAAVVQQIYSTAKAALDYASSLGEVSQQLGVTSRDLQVYSYAASQVGISQDEMEAGLAKLTKSIGMADAGAKVQATTFRDLGISVRDANGNVRTAGEIMPKLADALAQIKDPATRARIETELFGKAGQKLDTLLAGGSSAIDELRKAAADLGIVLSDEQIQNADKTADKLSEVKQVLEAKIAGAVADNVDAIFQLANAFESLVGKINPAIQAFKEWRAGVQARLLDVSSMIAGRPEDRAEYARLANAKRAEIQDMRSQAAFAELNRRFALPSSFGRKSSRDGALPTVKSSGGGGKPKTGKTQAEKDAEALQDLVEQARIDITNMRIGLDDNPDDALARIREEIAVRRDGERELADFERDYQAEILRQGEDRVRTLAGIFEDQFNGRAGSFWDNFRSLGMRAVSEIAARLLTNNGGQGGGLSAILGATGESLFGGLKGLIGLGGGSRSSFPSGLSSTITGAGPIFGGGSQGNPIGVLSLGSLPGLASGGRIGGFAGIDRNILSINGTPTARVGRGEMIRVEPENDNGGRIAHIVPSPYFNVVVDGRVASAAPGIVAGSSTGTQKAIARQQSRRLA